MQIQRSSLWKPLRNAGYRRLIQGQALSDFANWLDFLALSTVIVYAWGYGPMALAALSLAMALPWVIVGPLSSGYVQRIPAKMVLVGCDLLRACFVFLLFWVDSLPVLLFLVFMKMCMSAIFDPVRQSCIKSMVEPDQWAQAGSLSQIIVNGTKILAPLLGGLCIALWGAFSTFGIGAALYLISALVLLRLPQGNTGGQLGRNRSSGLRQSISLLRRKLLLKYAILFMAAGMFLIFLYDGLFVLFAQRLGLEESSLGIIMSAVGIGSVCGSFAAGHWTFWRDKPLQWMTRAGIFGGFLITIVGCGGFGWLPVSLWFWTPLFVLLGVSGGLNAVAFAYLLQSETTEETVGPVTALTNAILTGSMLAAPLLGAGLAAWIGAGGVFFSVGLLMVSFAWVFHLWVSKSHPYLIRPPAAMDGESASA